MIEYIQYACSCDIKVLDAAMKALKARQPLLGKTQKILLHAYWLLPSYTNISESMQYIAKHIQQSTSSTEDIQNRLQSLSISAGTADITPLKRASTY